MNTLTQNLKLGLSLLLLLAVTAGMFWIVSAPRDANGSPLRQKVVSEPPQREEPKDKNVELAAANPTLKSIYRRSAKEALVDTPSPNEIAVFEKLLKASFDVSFENDRQWKELGWILTRDLENGWVVIEESDSQRRGRGLFAIRTKRVNPIMIQATHRFFDTGTGVITRKLFKEHPVQAAAWNTVHRSEYDVAHQSRSFFNAFTRVLIETYPALVNFQIHGFDASKRQSPDTLAIVSNATRYPNQMTKDFAGVMKQNYGSDRVWLFPLETAELGATTNKQASVMREQGNQNFIHVEMSKSMRESLKGSLEDRSKLYSSFFSTADSFDR